MLTSNSIQYDTINYSRMNILNLCDNCDNQLDNKDIQYKALNNITGEVKQYCCKTCMHIDLTLLLED